ncbi:MAG: hypothetical protein ABIA04_01865 [Pseudomonadota bacterium]
MTLEGTIPATDIIQRSDISQMNIITRSDLITRNDLTSADVASSIMKSSIVNSSLSIYGLILVLIRIDDSGALHVEAEFTEEDYSFTFGFETFPDGIFQLSLYVKYENNEGDPVLYHVADFFDEASNSLFAFNDASIDFGTPTLDDTKLITPSDTSSLAQDDSLEAPALTAASQNIERVTFVIGRDDNEITLTGYSPSGNPISVYITNAPGFLEISATDDSIDSSEVTIDFDSSAAVEGIYPVSLIVKDNSTGIYTSHTPIIYVIEENQISTTPDNFVFESTLESDLSTKANSYPKITVYGSNYNKAFFAYNSAEGTPYIRETRYGAFSSSAVQVSDDTYRDSEYDVGWSLEEVTSTDSDGTNFVTASCSNSVIIIIRLIDSSFEVATRKVFNRDDFEGITAFTGPEISINKNGIGIVAWIANDGEQIYYAYINTNTMEVSDAYILDSDSLNHTVQDKLRLIFTNNNLLIIRNGEITGGKAFILANYENGALTNWRTQTTDTVNGEGGYYYELFGDLFTVYGDLAKDIAGYVYPSSGGYRILLFTSDGDKISAGGNLIEKADESEISVGWLVGRNGPISVKADMYGRIVVAWGTSSYGDYINYGLLTLPDGRIFSDDKFIVGQGTLNNDNLDACMLNDGRFAITYSTDDVTKINIYNNSQ